MEARRVSNAERVILPTTLADDPLWYKDAVIYELHVKAFYDATTTASATSRACAEARLPAGPRRHAHLAPAVLSLAARDDGYDISDYRTCIRPTARCATSGSSCARRTRGMRSSPSW
jgi:hypothetical protein